MKKLQFLFLMFLVLVLACRKTAIESIKSSIIGKWTYAEYSTGIVAPGQWFPATPPNETIEFKPDGSFITAQLIWSGANRFEILDSSTIKIQPASNSDGYILMGYSIDTTAKELFMSPINIISIEGFVYKFSR